MADIKVKTNNLFRNGKVNSYSDGFKSLDRERIQYEAEERDVYHLVTSEDSLDQLAFRYYAKQVADASKYWWVIADANAIDNPMDISEFIGTEILIPNIMNIQLRT